MYFLLSMKIFGYTTYANQARDRFEQAASNGIYPRLALLSDKMKLCDYEILLVSNSPLIQENLNDGWLEPQKLIALHTAWVNTLNHTNQNTGFPKKAWSIIEEMGEPLSPDFQKNNNNFFKKFREDLTGRRFFILLHGYEPYGLPVQDLNFLCNLWQLKENGFTPVHSASIIHEGKLFLFCGPHASGKSTIARLSESKGETILDEDLVLIPPMPAKNFSVRAWGYSLKTSTAPLCAIFKIIQDNEDRLIPLNQPQTAHFLVERSIEVLGNTLHDDMMGRLFKQIAAISRYVPGYELHFRKQHYFWKLIDEQILT